MSVYRVIDVIGTSEISREDAAATAIKTAESSVRGARVAEVVEQDIHITDGDQIVFPRSCGCPSSTRSKTTDRGSRCSGSSSQRSGVRQAR